MTLPAVDLPRETVTLSGGQTVEVRGLTRGEVMRMQGLGDETEIHVLALGTDTDLDEARAWHKQAPSATVEAIANAVMRLSGLGRDDAGRPTRTPSLGS